MFVCGWRWVVVVEVYNLNENDMSVKVVVYFKIDE